MNRRRSLLFIPGNSPGMIQNADLFDADGVIFDLEDAVSVDEKDAARDLVVSALETFDFDAMECVVRINPMDTPQGAVDLRALKQALPDTILVPKADEDAIRRCDHILSEIETELGMDLYTVGIIALIETAYGIEFASSIVRTSRRVNGILLGGEDFTSDMEVERTKGGMELDYARNRLATLSRAMAMTFFDTPFVDVDDPLGLLEDCKKACSIGATGKAAINPRQVRTIHEAFTPDAQTIGWAKEVLDAWKRAEAENRGVFSLRGKMVDAPVKNRAEKILIRAGINAGGNQDA